MKNNLKFIFLGIIFVVALLTNLSLVKSEMGCCFTPSNGVCAMNADSASCTANNGEFSSSTTCSITKCQKGCCTLGTNTQFVTARACEILSRSSGFEYPGNFQDIDEEACLAAGSGESEGACIYESDYERDCTYTSYSKCSTGNFYEGLTCTDPSLRTNCNKTSKTKCYNEDVYAVDSCGNPDGKKTDCDYGNGTICSQKNATTAICKNLNCAGGKKNGDSWCVDLFGNGGVGIKTIEGLGIEGDNGWPTTRPTVGSRSFRQLCLDGNITTEPCADFRMEMCSDEGSGEAKCELNKAADCFGANLEEVDETANSKVNAEDCSEKSCRISNPANLVEEKQCFTYNYKTPGGLRRSQVLCGDELNDPYANIDKSPYGDDPTPGAKDIEQGASVEDDKKIKQLVEDLHLEMCVPLVKTGLNFYSSSASPTETAICSTANYESKINFMKDQEGNWWFVSPDENCNTYGNAGLLNITAKELDHCDTSDDVVANKPRHIIIHTQTGGERLVTALDKIVEDDVGNIPLNGFVVKSLMARCKSISDCGGEWSWLGKDMGDPDLFLGKYITIDAEKDLFEVRCKLTLDDDHKKVECTFAIECKTWKAPEGNNDCKQCGADKLACSEYRCRSLGDGCEYYEPEGADKSYCISSNDRTPPKITLKSILPNATVPPYTPVTITINTDEDAQCKFNLNNAGGTYDNMTYNFGSGFSKVHTVTLSLPGQLGGSVNRTGNITQVGDLYPLITRDGNYTLYVRCIDVPGNGKTAAAKPIKFQVMQYPDTTSPFLRQFNPISGSYIKYNTTEKQISFKMNEPAQCKWGLEDKDYDLMTNYFSCDTSINTNSIVNGYACSGRLIGITLNLSQQTRFYIKCKDQPWLEGKETTLYKRNKHTSMNDYEYILRPSEKLEILEVAPSGNIIKSAGNNTVNLRALTEGGGESGNANCSWRLSLTENFSTIYNPFFETGEQIHNQALTHRPNGTTYVQVKCFDSAENIANKTINFNLTIDSVSPIIGKVYYESGSLKLYTNEEASCYSSTNRLWNCIYDFANATIMSGFEKEHTIDWENGENYYIRCQDYFGNENNGCGVIVRTY